MSGEPSEPLSRAEAAAIAIALRERVAEARGVLLWGEQALRVAATLDAARPAPLDVDVLARAMDSVLRSQDRVSSLFREDAAAIDAEYLREYAR